MFGSLANALIERIVQRSLDFEKEDCIEAVSRIRTARPSTEPRVVASAVVDHFARKGAITGFIAGFASNPLLSIPLALLDTEKASQLSAKMAASVAYIARPTFFEDPTWKDETLSALSVGEKADARDAEAQTDRARRFVIRGFVTSQSQKAVRRAVTRWIGRRVAERAVLTKLVPVVGGIVSAAWNYVELRRVGGRVVVFYFGKSEAAAALHAVPSPVVT